LPAPGTPGSLGANTSFVIRATGEVSLGSGVYYLQFPNGNLFGYWNIPLLDEQSFILYHYDLGFESFVDAGSGAAYLFDFSSGHSWYTSLSLFPYIYDFT
jgi:hypothetical protein